MTTTIEQVDPTIPLEYAQEFRIVRPWAYWQFKNGRTAPIWKSNDLTFDGPEWDCAWDRSLGAYVCYAR